MITDGTFICKLCGEWLTGCHLCGTAPLLDCRDIIQNQIREEREAEWELQQQERAIRQAAELRAKGLL